MKISLITKYIPNDKNASQKAPLDVERIIEEEYDVKKERVYKVNIKYIRNIESMIRCIIANMKYRKNCVSIVQWPLMVGKPLKNSNFCNSATYKIALIHDIDSIRFCNEDKKACEIEINELNKFDVVITHNQCMTQWLNKNGFNKNVVELELFDYLSDYSKLQEQNIKDYSIVFAGNLQKSIFLRNISQVVKSKMNLYGNLPDYELDQNIIYKGSFSPDELCEHIEGSFGLIWDGETTQTCGGINGYYMMFNNPHKLSLYMACGLPVITWRRAAISNFIEKNKVGFVVDDLSEIDFILEQLSLDEYNKMCANVNKIREKVCKGYYTKTAIKKALELVVK